MTASASASIVAKFATIAGGCWIEENGSDERRDSDRCFRFDSAGRAEYATLGDLKANGDRARWFAHQFTARDFILA